MSDALPRPDPATLDPFFARYLEVVPDGSVLDLLAEQARATQALLRDLPDAHAQYRYAPGKWSVQEVLGHLVDAERIFTYRALCFARGETAALPGFDHDAYVAAAQFDARSLRSLLEEYAAVRQATLRFYESLTPEAAARSGIANGRRVSVAALAWITAGHERVHQRTLRERYLGSEAANFS